MISSMTGYGKADYLFSDHKTIVEIRSLNSKQLDLNMKIAPFFREHEADIRAMLTAPLERGKVDVSIYTEDASGHAPSDTFTPINKEAFAYYYRELKALQQELSIPEQQDLISPILRMPDVIRPAAGNTTVSDEEWALLQQAIQQALEAFIAFRVQEGAALQAMFTDKLDGIAALLAEVEPYEKSRVEKIRQRLLGNLKQLAEETRNQVDENRLEAELIYYLEKLDITEEKVRLTNHIKYFREVMGEGLPVMGEGLPVTGVGKKLGFIAQEMGREINTLGSKSNQSEMQIIVVKMKDILEQIKEQVLNVL